MPRNINTPRPYQICTHCVSDTTDRRIEFNEEGVCDRCTDFYNSTLPVWKTDETGRKSLEKTLEKIRKEGRGNTYDCVLGVSGGQDSSYMLHLCVKEFGLRPLVFHVDGGWNTEQAVHNIQAIIEKLGTDFFTEVVNWEEMRDFQLAFFKSGTPYLDIPQDHAFIGALYRFAHKNKIKYILNGGNISTECVNGSLNYYYYGTDMVLIRDIRKQFGTSPMSTFPFSSIYRHKVYLKYFHGLKVVKPLNYVPYIKSQVAGLLESEYGWKPFPEKHHESRFTRFFEGYWLPKRFGFDPRRNQYASLILTQQMTREEALRKLALPVFEPGTLENEFSYIASKLRISVGELTQYMNAPQKFFWDYKNQKTIFNLGASVLKFTGTEISIKK